MAAVPLLTIVVPTYNERENVEHLVDLIEQALIGIATELVFVDDSDDDTASVLHGLKSSLSITILHREPANRQGGLGTALAAGLQAANGSFICVLDADLQHPPAKVPELLQAALSEEADVVVASRYIEGGSADTMPFGRRLVSLASKWISRILFHEKLKHTSDPGSGFFLIRREVIEGAVLRPLGYKMLTEVLMRGTWSVVAEVPYRFQIRAAGTSKATIRQGVQYVTHTLRLFGEVPDAARFWKFLLVGATGVAVNLGLVWLLAVAGLPNHAAWAGGVEASILTNFLLNRSFTWRDQARRGFGAVGEALRYHVTCLLAIGANAIAFTAATLAAAPLMLAALIGIVAGTAASFRGVSTWVFRTEHRAPMPLPHRDRAPVSTKTSRPSPIRRKAA